MQPHGLFGGLRRDHVLGVEAHLGRVHRVGPGHEGRDPDLQAEPHGLGAGCLEHFDRSCSVPANAHVEPGEPGVRPARVALGRQEQRNRRGVQQPLGDAAREPRTLGRRPRRAEHQQVGSRGLGRMSQAGADRGRLDPEEGQRGAERGIGRLIIESEARAEASGMMVAVIVLMLVGVALSAVIWRLQAYLLRWQQHNMAE